MEGIFNKTRVNDLGFGLDVLSEKNRQVARNIANADTPMYKGKKLEFNEVMADYMGNGKNFPLFRTNDRHLPISNVPLNPKDYVRHQNNPSLRTDGNDVNIDYEMSEQAESSIMYSLLTEMVGGKFASLKDVIKSR